MTPCTGICDLVSSPDKFCRSCGRTYKDIRFWGGMTEEEQIGHAISAAKRLRNWASMQRASQAATPTVSYYPS